MSSAITQMAMVVIAKEQAEKLAKEQAELQAVIARREEEERSVMRQRVALEAERLMAAKEAERLVAEERAARARETEEVALRAEIERLRNRSETEILRDEVAEMKRQMAAFLSRSPDPEAVHLRERVVELDTLYKSALSEVKEMKTVVDSLLKGGFRIVTKNMAFYHHARGQEVGHLQGGHDGHNVRIWPGPEADRHGNNTWILLPV